VNIAYYSSLPKTLKLTPPELMRNAGYQLHWKKVVNNSLLDTAFTAQKAYHII
jgi:hypothetical protein